MRWFMVGLATYFAIVVFAVWALGRWLPVRRVVVGSDPLNCPGCHDGDMADFDHFCDYFNVSEAETPHAFAAFMGNKYAWKGDYGKAGGDDAA